MYTCTCTRARPHWPQADSHSVFLWVVVLGCTCGPLLLLVAFLVWAKRQGFLSV